MKQMLVTKARLKRELGLRGDFNMNFFDGCRVIRYDMGKAKEIFQKIPIEKRGPIYSIKEIVKIFGVSWATIYKDCYTKRYEYCDPCHLSHCEKLLTREKSVIDAYIKETGVGEKFLTKQKIAEMKGVPLTTIKKIIKEKNIVPLRALGIRYDITKFNKNMAIMAASASLS